MSAIIGVSLGYRDFKETNLDLHHSYLQAIKKPEAVRYYCHHSWKQRI